MYEESKRNHIGKIYLILMRIGSVLMLISLFNIGLKMLSFLSFIVLFGDLITSLTTMKKSIKNINL